MAAGELVQWAREEIACLQQAQRTLNPWDPETVRSYANTCERIHALEAWCQRQAHNPSDEPPP